MLQKTKKKDQTKPKKHKTKEAWPIGWETVPPKVGRLCKVTAGQIPERDGAMSQVEIWEGLQAQGSKPVKTETCGAESQPAASVAGRETLLR